LSFIILISLFILNFGSLYAYETIWVKDYAKIAFQTLPKAPQESVLILDRFYVSPIWNYYTSGEDDFSVAGIWPRENGDFDLLLVNANDTLKGDYQLISCSEIGSADILLYDPAYRFAREGRNWPPCIAKQLEWIFDPASQNWEVYKD
jgi:hypothetical protein